MISTTILTGVWSLLLFIIARLAGLAASAKFDSKPLLADWIISITVFLALLPTLSVFLGVGLSG